MSEVFTNRKGTLRLYDNTAVTPLYLELAFDAGDLSAPIGRPLVEEMPKIHRGKMDGNAHYITGSEEVHLQGLDLSFSAMVSDLANFEFFKDLIDCLNGAATAVNANTIVTTKGTTQNDGSTNNPAFADSNKKTVNVEILYDGASNDYGYKFSEVYIPYPTISEGDEAVTVAIAAQIYGTITRITAFTTGSDMTA